MMTHKTREALDEQQKQTMTAENKGNGSLLWDYTQCNKSEKQMLHGVCIYRGLFNFKCSINNQNCVAYLGKLNQ